MKQQEEQLLCHTNVNTLIRMKEDMVVGFITVKVSQELSRNDFLEHENENVDCGIVLVIHAHLCCF